MPHRDGARPHPEAVLPPCSFSPRFPATRIPLSFALVAFLCLFNGLSFQTRTGVIHPTFSFVDIAVIVGSFAGALIWWFIIGTLLSIGPHSYLAALGIHTFLYQLFATYRFHTKISFDVALFLESFDEIWNTESMMVILDSISAPHVLLIGLGPILAVLIVPPLRRRVMAERQWRRRRPIAAAAATPLYAALLLSPYALYDDLGSVIRSGYDYVRRDSLYSLPADVDIDAYPFMVSDASFVPRGPSERHPSIIIVQIESFSQQVVEKMTPDGRPFTPYFNEKLKEGLYVERFYANSIQSSRGQFASLFSLIPSFKQKVFTTYTETRFQSLAQVLKDHGYATAFFKAYRDINFDNTGNFLGKNGFDVTLSIVPFLTDEDKKEMWGWGIEDRIFYRRFFEYLDSREDIASGQRPVFAVLHTVMNHMRFDEVPQEQRRLYPEAETLPQHYANSIRLTDEQLPLFFEELAKRTYLKDTVVIVTGDHSYPLNEHGYQHNEAAFYEEFFRTPFLLLAPGRLEPERITDKAFCQMDIAPTLIDLVGIKPKHHHFRGVSLFAAKPQQPIYLIQPYNSVYLGVIDGGRWKYVRHLRTDREYLYDLERDPQEKKNLAEEVDPAFKEQLSGLLQTIYLNQRLIETDRVWNREAVTDEPAR